nr:ranbpm [Cryptomonas curvata]
MLISFNLLEKYPFNFKIIFLKNRKRIFNIGKYKFIAPLLFFNIYFQLISQFFFFLENFLNTICFNIKKKIKNLQNSYQLIFQSYKFARSVPFNISKVSDKTCNKWCLENRWNWLEKKKKSDWGDIEISIDGFKVLYKGLGKNDEDAAAIRSAIQIPRSQGIFYFETKIINAGRSGFIGIGFCSKKVDLDRLPGWERDSLGYHGDDGNIFKDSGIGISYGPYFTTGDTIGLCWNLIKKTIFFTKNGTALNTAFFKYCPFSNKEMFPVVGLRTPGELIEVNFSKSKFEFDISSYVKKESQILIEKTIKLRNPVNSEIIFENCLLKIDRIIKKMKILMFSIKYVEKEKFIVFLEIFYYICLKRKNKICKKLILIISQETKKLFLMDKNTIANTLKFSKKKIYFDYYLFIMLAKYYIYKSKKNFKNNFYLNKTKIYLSLFLLLNICNKILKNQCKCEFFHTFFPLFSNSFLILNNIYEIELIEILLIIVIKRKFWFKNLYINFLIQQIGEKGTCKYKKIRYNKIKKLFLESLLISKISKFYNYDFNLVRCIDLQYYFILKKLWY